MGCECDRYVEIWNLVFSQFNNDGQGNYTDLVQKNIDTGMGLERLACVMQGVDNLFLVDTVQNIMKHVSKISGVEYGGSEEERRVPAGNHRPYSQHGVYDWRRRTAFQ